MEELIQVNEATAKIYDDYFSGAKSNFDKTKNQISIREQKMKEEELG